MIVFCWAQLPIYAARSIGAFVRATNEEVVVLRTVTNRFPIKGAAEMTGTKVIEVKPDDQRSLVEVVGAMPRVIVCGGWGIAAFWRWLKEVKQAGGKTVVCTDEPYRGRGWYEWVRKIRFNLQLRCYIDMMFVAGGGGELKFADYYGMPKDRVITGMYAGDPELFHDGRPIIERPKRFIYVGHWDENKNVLKMCRAFTKVQRDDWTLEVYGGGPLEVELRKLESDYVHILGYVNADELGPMYRDTRCFVLGSFREQWGVVVHEACMSGCMLLLSDRVGSKFDFAMPENAVLFDPESEEDFARGFKAIMDKPEGAQMAAQVESVELGRRFSPAIFARNLSQMISQLSS